MRNDEGGRDDGDVGPESPTLAAGAEPIPGYKLVRRLGRGGAGEVWEALGPGGFRIAQKFIPLDEPLGDREVEALEFVKDVRHPRLLAMFASWRVGGFLAIGMELADRSLWDRFREVARGGPAGIPAPEASRYLSEAAEGLDHLNAARIQHRDCKPLNLLLLGDSLKVGDFGLAMVVRSTSARNSGGLTPDYAPPEFFRGRTTGRSDQYSLAATYVHVRTGRTPFVGNFGEIMAGHLGEAPDLDGLLAGEREAVARALSKDPGGRWPSCRAFAEAVGRGLRTRACWADDDGGVAPTTLAIPVTMTVPTRVDHGH